MSLASTLSRTHVVQQSVVEHHFARNRRNRSYNHVHNAFPLSPPQVQLDRENHSSATDATSLCLCRSTRPSRTHGVQHSVVEHQFARNRRNCSYTMSTGTNNTFHLCLPDVKLDRLNHSTANVATQLCLCRSTRHHSGSQSSTLDSNLSFRANPQHLFASIMPILPSNTQIVVTPPELTPIRGKPTANTLAKLISNVYEKAADVPTALSGGINGHPGALLSPTGYDPIARYQANETIVNETILRLLLSMFQKNNLYGSFPTKWGEKQATSQTWHQFKKQFHLAKDLHRANLTAALATLTGHANAAINQSSPSNTNNGNNKTTNGANAHFVTNNRSAMYYCWNQDAKINRPHLPPAARHIPSLPDLKSDTLLSSGQVCDAGCDITTTANKIDTASPNGDTIPGKRDAITKL